MQKRNVSFNIQEHILPDGSMSAELKGFLENIAEEWKRNPLDHKQPPWLVFPEYKRYSMGWKMGSGEDHLHAFRSWIRSLEKKDVMAFISNHPEPEGWKGFYDSISCDR